MSRGVHRLVPLVMIAWALAACQAQQPPLEGADAGPWRCVDDQDCPPEQTCRSGVCETWCAPGPDAALPPSPDIAVEPRELDFFYVPFGTEWTLPLVVYNQGTADLEIREIHIFEPSLPSELSTAPGGVQEPALVVPPGGSLTIAVTMHALDLVQEFDALLEIASNDPDEPVVTVYLSEGCKCCGGALEVCALDGTLPAPEPFVDCSVDDWDAPRIDFGEASDSADATRLVAVRVGYLGSSPITITDVRVTDTTGQGDHFSLELFFLEQDPNTGDSTEVPAGGFPLDLRTGSQPQGIPEDRLFVRLWYTPMGLASVPAEHLWIDTSDDGPLAIPFVGGSSGP